MSLHVVGGDGDGKNKGGRPSGEFDPWSTEKSHEYSLDSFYTRSTNKHDHSAEGKFRMPPHIQAAISQIVDSKQFPQLRSLQDFYRDAAIHRLHYLNQKIGDGKLAKQLSLEMRACRVDEMRREVEDLKNIVDNHTMSLELALQMRDRDAISEALAILEDDLPAVRQPYRSMLKQLAVKFRDELKRLPEVEDDDV
jgi:hypothetical protein